MRSLRCLATALCGLAVAAPLPAADPPKDDKKPAPVSYHKDIRPLFVQHCQGCHQPAKPQGAYVMTSFADLLKAGETAKPAVVPGSPEKSNLLAQVTAKDGKAEMPKGRDPLTPHQVGLVTAWIKQGAVDDSPKSAAEVVIDQNHPPVYLRPPVVTSLAYSPDGQTLAVAGYHEVLLHKADGSGLVGRLVGLSERITSVAYSPDGELLAAAGGSPGRFGEVQIWDVQGRKLKVSVTVTFDTLNGVSWSPDGTKVAFGCNDNTLRAIDAQTGKQVLFQGAHSDWVLGTVFSQDGAHLVSVSRDRSMKLTEVETQRFIDNITSITPGALKGGLAAVARRPLKEKKMQKLPPDTPGVPAKVYDELLVAGADGMPRLYMMHREKKRVIGDDFNKVREFERMPGRVCAVTFNREGNLFAAGNSLDGTAEVRVYQADDGKVVSKLEAKPGPVYAVEFRPDGRELASAGFDGMVRLSDPMTGKLIREFVAVPLTKSVASK